MSRPSNEKRWEACPEIWVKKPFATSSPQVNVQPPMVLRILPSRFWRAQLQRYSIAELLTTHSTRTSTVGHDWTLSCKHWSRKPPLSKILLLPLMSLSNNTSSRHSKKSSEESYQWQKRFRHDLIGLSQLPLAPLWTRCSQSGTRTVKNMIEKIEDTVKDRYNLATSTESIDVHPSHPPSQTMTLQYRALSHSIGAHAPILNIETWIVVSAVLILTRRSLRLFRNP